MLPDVWGRFLWYSIHFIALDYPLKPSDEDRQSYKHFFETLWKVIPCYKCGQNYKRHLEELPLTGSRGDYLESRDALFTWTVELHNIVNRELGKPEMGVDEARVMFMNQHFVDPRSVTMAATMRNEAEQKEEKMVQAASAVLHTSKNKNIFIAIGVLVFILAIIMFFMRTKPTRKIKMR